MKSLIDLIRQKAADLSRRLGLGLRSKLIIIFLLVKVIPLILLAVIAWRQFTIQGDELRSIAVTDSSTALNDSAVENIERMTTDAARAVAEFLYDRDDDLLYLAAIPPDEEEYRRFAERTLRKVVKKGRWRLSADGRSWEPTDLPPPPPAVGGWSSNVENEDMNGFRHRPPILFEHISVPLYDEITFIGLDGQELIKVIPPGSTKTRHALSPEKKNVSRRENTYIKAETYFEELRKLKPGQIYVSDVIGAYVGSNYIGLYTPENVSRAAGDRGYDIAFTPEEQSYAGLENPNGRRFEGLVRWGTPVADKTGAVIGYLTLALNHDHIMEFVDHLTPMPERYTRLPSAYEGNYAFIWDYRCRSIAHPRHHSIVGFDPESGEPQIPWLEESLYEGWRQSGLAKWTDYIQGYPAFHEQSRAKRPAPELTRQGLVGLDGRYLNNAPQCTGWMDLTADGGSGSFYILWSGLYKLNTAAAIPYYTGPYAPSLENGYSRRGFGFVAIGSGLDFFTRPARATEEKLASAVAESLRGTFFQLTATTAALIVLVVLIAIWMASFLTNRITQLIKGISRFRAGERQFRFHSEQKDEFGTLADSFDDMADSIVASVRNPLVIIGMDRRIIYMNGEGLALCGKTLSEVAGTYYRDNSIYPEGGLYDPVKALEDGLEAQVFSIDGGRRHMKGVAHYLLSKEGDKVGYIIETQDVTEMVLKQIALEKAMNEAQRANEHKGEFLARMSHEIRTPMNAIIGLTNVVQRNLEEMGDESTEMREIMDHVRQVESSSQHLLYLLNDILDISKIEAGKIVLAEEPVPLPELIETVAGIIRPRCAEKKIDFSISFTPFEPSTFLTDSLRLRQVLINLLGNAVKFTPVGGQVEFSVARSDRRQGQTLVKFAVRDTGIGFSRQAARNIFQPFEQASSQITRQYGGTGLGLSISRHIVKIFGGDIMVNSREGEGSEFSFAVWLKETRPTPKAAPVKADSPGLFAGRKALLVDDMELNRKVAKAMLRRTGLTIDEAEDGQAAVRLFSQSPVGGYDVILMDVLMPNMDGYEASRIIRALDRPDAATVPILALTANAFKEDIDKALESGMNAHIAKPVKPDQLVDALIRFLKKSD